MRGREGERSERGREGEGEREFFKVFAKNNFCSNNSRDFTKNSDKFSTRTKKAMAKQMVIIHAMKQNS